MNLKQMWQWWRRLKPAIFITLSVLFVVIDIFLAPRHLYLVTVYIFIVTGAILFLLYRFHEDIPAVDVPVLQPLPAKKRVSKLDISEILSQEFEYVKETASQAMNDRHTMVNYFLLSAGVVLAGFGLMVSEEGGAHFAYRYEVLVAMSLLFNIIGWVYFMQVVRLRQAWCESARAMNHLKVLFAKNCDLLPDLAEKAFRWKIKSIPPAGKKMTVFYFSALLISILSAAAVMLASIILLDSNLLRESDALKKYIAIPQTDPFISFGLGFYHLIFQMSMYTALLEESFLPKEERKNESDAHHTPSPENRRSRR